VEYLRALLARDHAEIHAALDRGEYRSVRAAARAAGIVRPTCQVYTDSLPARPLPKLGVIAAAEGGTRTISCTSRKWSAHPPPPPPSPLPSRAAKSPRHTGARASRPPGARADKWGGPSPRGKREDGPGFPHNAL
jgi:hypothetical protein